MVQCSEIDQVATLADAMIEPNTEVPILNDAVLSSLNGDKYQ
jgi:hypothetical protein